MHALLTWNIPVIAALVLFTDMREARGQENLVVGVVQLEGESKLREGVVTVSVMRRPITDKALNEDGVYLLKVPTEDNKKFQLWFEGPSNYWHEFSPVMDNDQLLRRLPKVVLKKKNPIRDVMDTAFLTGRIKAMAAAAKLDEAGVLKVRFEKELKGYAEAIRKKGGTKGKEAIELMEEAWGTQLLFRPKRPELPFHDSRPVRQQAKSLNQQIQSDLRSSKRTS